MIDWYSSYKIGSKTMNEFNKALTYVNELLYAPHHLTIKNIQEETQNADYGAGMFQLDSKSVRFRVAKITPTKVGQFVSFWEKDAANKNQAFSYENATDLLVINTFHTNGDFGQFVFPKEVLLQQNILKTANTKGKWLLEFTLVGIRPPANRQSQLKSGNHRILLKWTLLLVYQSMSY